MKLDLESLETQPTDKIPGFFERMQELLPSLFEHHCSEGYEGGFYERVKRGTWIGHVVEHIALELQTLAGMNCGFGRTRGTGKDGVYNVVFEYEVPKAGMYAAKAAVRIADALVEGDEYDLESDIRELKRLHGKFAYGPSTGSIVSEAIKRNIPVTQLDDCAVMLGYGKFQESIEATVTSRTTNLSVEIACNKERTKDKLDAAGIPVPKGEIVYDIEGLLESIDRLGFPLVMKPLDGNHGRGATINITTTAMAVDALKVAQKISKDVIVEKFITGFDHRLLVVNYKLVAAALRTPACVIGDGRSTIEELVAKENLDPRRGNGHANVLTQITIDDHTLSLLAENDLSLDSIPAVNEVVYLKATANLSTGGTATDITEELHPYNKWMAERIAKVVGLDVCGIDIMATDLKQPITECGGAVLEVNAAPGFRMHLAPSAGKPRNVARAVVDMLFPPGRKSTVPIIAVTGTNGKTTAVRLISHMATIAGYTTGYTTTDGITVNGYTLEKGDCTGPISAAFVLRDPTIDFAVLECARGGLLREGLAFNHCDVGIVTNLSEDHIGSQGIRTIYEMARVKSVIPECVHQTGLAVLNSDDDLVYNMRHELECNVALFSRQGETDRIKEHCENGGLAAIAEEGYVTLIHGDRKARIDVLSNIPLLHEGKAEFMLESILPAVLTGYDQGFSIEEIREALRTFKCSPSILPGRLNLFENPSVKVLVDFAHNPAALDALGSFVEKSGSTFSTGIISAYGDRRDEDIIALGASAGKNFKRIIIRMNKDLFGRTEDEIKDLLIRGIISSNPSAQIEYVPQETLALSHAFTTAKHGEFIVACVENAEQCISVMEKLSVKDEVISLVA